MNTSMLPSIGSKMAVSVPFSEEPAAKILAQAVLGYVEH